MKSQHKSKKKSKISIVFIILFFIIAGSGVGIRIYHHFSSFIKKPLIKEAPEITFTVLGGQSLSNIAENLEKQGLITDSLYFSIYVKLKKAERKLKAGEYTLSASQSPEEIFAILIEGRVKQYKTTIAEGLTIKDIASIVESRKLCDSISFTALCYDPDFIKELGIDNALSLEGYLFPDTYFFPRDNTCKSLIIAMVDRFKSVFIPEWKEQAEKLNCSIHEVVILASMIEKEAAYNSDRHLISSVFHNRIKRKMRFQSDPTAVYGLDGFSGKIKRSHIRAESPYNTYKIDGFPPGPIASPGASSLKAALYPAKSDYLYFVSKDGRTHHFSKSYKEHRQAIDQFLKGQ